MDETQHREAIQEVHGLYMAACQHHEANPDDSEGISRLIDTMLGRSMDLFLGFIDAVTPETSRVVFRRTVLTDERRAELARDGMVPYQRPITLEELMAEQPGMVPLLLLRAAFCWRFHSWPVRAMDMRHWKRFVANYAERLPNLG